MVVQKIGVLESSADAKLVQLGALRFTRKIDIYLYDFSGHLFLLLKFIIHLLA